MCQTVLCQGCSTLVQRLPHKSEQLPWPDRSPDLAPIEHVLDIVSQNTRSHDNVRTNHQMIAELRHNWERSPRMTKEPLLVRCYAGALPVCGLTEAITLIKHYVTSKNDPYPVL